MTTPPLDNLIARLNGIVGAPGFKWRQEYRQQILDTVREAVVELSRLRAEPTPTPTPEAEKTWFILREPNCVPERKGPFAADQVKGFLRELMAARPNAFITVLTFHGSGPSVQDGPECLEMLDGRFASTAAKHRANTKAAFAVNHDALFEQMVKALRRLINLDGDCDYIDGEPERCPGLDQIEGQACHWCEARTALGAAKAAGGES